MSAVTRESVAAELLTLSEQMDRVAHNMDELALVYGDDKPPQEMMQIARADHRSA